MRNNFILIFIILSSMTSAWADGHDLDKSIESLDSLKAQMNELSLLKSAGPIAYYTNLKNIGEELKEIAPDFHKQVLRDLEVEKPLHGAQLTLLHKIVGVFVELDYKLIKISEASINETLRVLSLFDRYENFNITYLPFYKEKKFRRLVNAEDSSYEVERKELKRQLRLLINKKEIEATKILFHNFEAKVRRGDISGSDPLVSVTLNHSSGKLINQKKFWSKWRRRLVGQTLADLGSRVGSNIVHHLSGAFGNSAGSIRWRKGWLWKNEEIRKEIHRQLKPLDIITEKVSYTPTDFFIPGHFGHNAIWLGTKEQLEALNLWNSSAIKPFQKDILAGRSIIETDRSGTHFKSLENFMNVDEFGLLRFRKDTLDVQSEREKVLKIYEVALAQLGKKYDFNFDVETTDKLVCSELLYQSFGSVNWPTEPYVGRTTISPDNVVSLALFDNPPVDLIYFAKGTKSGQVVYKDITDLASDIGFVEKDGVYKRPYKVCKNERVKKPGDRGSETINKRTCETKLEDLIYIPHRPLPDLTVSF
jgi:hypothetical protein